MEGVSPDAPPGSAISTNFPHPSPARSMHSLTCRLVGKGSDGTPFRRRTLAKPIQISNSSRLNRMTAHGVRAGGANPPRYPIRV